MAIGRVFIGGHSRVLCSLEAIGRVLCSLEAIGRVFIGGHR